MIHSDIIDWYFTIKRTPKSNRIMLYRHYIKTNNKTEQRRIKEALLKIKNEVVI